jgi:hypothetical protein
VIKPGESNSTKVLIQPVFNSEINRKVTKELPIKTSNDKNSGSGSMKISSQNSYSAKYQK